MVAQRDDPQSKKYDSISQHLDAAVFDLDGVVTFTAHVHEAAWKELFDGFISSLPADVGSKRRPFDENDYHLYVDGRPRYDGVQTFLESRGIALPYGHHSDPPDARTVYGLGNRKDQLFQTKLKELGVKVDFSAVRLIRELRGAEVRVGVASSSENTTLVLEHAHLLDLFQAQIDGAVSERLHLRGKPHPDIFLMCLHQLGASDPSRAMVTEDAVAGVEAGRAGGFGFVLGVNRGGNEHELYVNGADWVISDFAEVSIQTLTDAIARARESKNRAAGQGG